eukprot:COSAG01_NODE_2724_length_7183_cov_4.796414_4_plen_530_part_00
MVAASPYSAGRVSVSRSFERSFDSYDSAQTCVFACPNTLLLLLPIPPARGAAHPWRACASESSCARRRKLRSRPDFMVGATAGARQSVPLLAGYDGLRDPYLPQAAKRRASRLKQRGAEREQRQITRRRWERSLGGGVGGGMHTWMHGESQRWAQPDSRLRATRGGHGGGGGGGGRCTPGGMSPREDYIGEEFSSSRHALGGVRHPGRSPERASQGARTPLYTRSGLSASGLRSPAEGLPAGAAGGPVEVVASGWLSEVPELPTDMGPGSRLGWLTSRWFTLSRDGQLAWSESFDTAHRPATDHVAQAVRRPFLSALSDPEAVADVAGWLAGRGEAPAHDRPGGGGGAALAVRALRLLHRPIQGARGPPLQTQRPALPRLAGRPRRGRRASHAMQGTWPPPPPPPARPNAWSHAAAWLARGVSDGGRGGGRSSLAPSHVTWPLATGAVCVSVRARATPGGWDGCREHHTCPKIDCRPSGDAAHGHGEGAAPVARGAVDGELGAGKRAVAPPFPVFLAGSSLGNACSCRN